MGSNQNIGSDSEDKPVRGSGNKLCSRQLYFVPDNYYDSLLTTPQDELFARAHVNFFIPGQQGDRVITVSTSDFLVVIRATTRSKSGEIARSFTLCNLALGLLSLCCLVCAFYSLSSKTTQKPPLRLDHEDSEHPNNSWTQRL